MKINKQLFSPGIWVGLAFAVVAALSVSGEAQASSSMMPASAEWRSPAETQDLAALFKELRIYLPKSSQAENRDAILNVIRRLEGTGVCHLEGPDHQVRPGMVGLQCLLEEVFVAKRDFFRQGDFEIHTTMPSTPCCKLPSASAKEALLTAFGDEARLVTVDGRSASLDAIAQASNATLHLTYTKAGYAKRSEEQRLAYDQYWAPRVHATELETCEAFSSGLNGATYRLVTRAGSTIYFGIQASQAKDANSKAMTVHLGPTSQPEVKRWLTGIEEGLVQLDRKLFER